MTFQLPLCHGCEAAMTTGEYLSTLHCCICDYEYDDTDLYNLHILIIHVWKGDWRGRDPPSAPFACADCQQDYYDEKGFNNHLKEHEMTQNAMQEMMESEYKRSSSPAGAPEPLQSPKTPKPPKPPKQKKKKWLKKEKSPKNTLPGPPDSVQPPDGTEQPKNKKKKNKICPDCNRDFASKKARRLHECPNRYPCISNKCRRTLRSLKGLTDHLESGACKGGYNRENISRLLCERDTKGLITVPGALKLLEEHYRAATEIPDDVQSDLGDAMEKLSLSSSWGVLTPVSNVSGDSFEIVASEGVPLDLDNFDVISLASGCTLSDATPGSPDPSIIISEPINPKQCQICFKVFRRVEHLQQHLESPAHAPKIYHCQLSFLGLESRGPVKEFKTLSGLVSHIENGSCRGGMTAFDVALNMLNNLAEELGLSGTTDAQQKLIAVASSRLKTKNA
ncbi:hypothetical protein TWF718_006487 [Orbilia javanica]|uniref:C2H2-type domain-containing protein n=1 Tax=Orbilia javanica TaxID=47235 RepID=A0AAN8REC6_9PEZI